VLLQLLLQCVFQCCFNLLSTVVVTVVVVVVVDPECSMDSYRQSMKTFLFLQY